jgi:antitoxin component YwqK of YwqJK toxin-antitoxin module
MKKAGILFLILITYTDTTKKQIESIGRYRAGTEKGKWKYYSENGTIRKKEKFRRNKIITTTYYPEGIRQSKGLAVIVKEDIYLHYYYTGAWKYFTRRGKLEKIVVYYKGAEVSSTEVLK